MAASGLPTLHLVEPVGEDRAFTAGVLAALADCRAAKLLPELAASVRRLRGPPSG